MKRNYTIYGKKEKHKFHYSIVTSEYSNRVTSKYISPNQSDRVTFWIDLLIQLEFMLKVIKQLEPK
jgi:hypothetical protein